MVRSYEQSLIPHHIEITSKVFGEIEKTVGSFHAETGGILGMRGNTIDRFFFDKTPNGATSLSYTPNHTAINQVLSDEWTPTNTIYMGNVHSHPVGLTRPSSGDEYYAKQLLDHIKKNFSEGKKYFYIPIVQSAADIGQFALFSYIACYRNGIFRIEPIDLCIDGQRYQPKPISYRKPLWEPDVHTRQAINKPTVLYTQSATQKPADSHTRPIAQKPLVASTQPVVPLNPIIQPASTAMSKPIDQPEPPITAKPIVQSVSTDTPKPITQPGPSAPPEPTVQHEPITSQVSSEQHNSEEHDNTASLQPEYSVGVKGKTVICIGIEHVRTYLKYLAQFGVENFVLLNPTRYDRANTWQQDKTNEHIREGKSNANIKFADVPFLDTMTKSDFLQAVGDSCKRCLNSRSTNVLIADLRTGNATNHHGISELAHGLYTPHVKLDPLTSDRDSKRILFKCPGDVKTTIGFEGNVNKISEIKKIIGLLLFTYKNRFQIIQEATLYAKHNGLSMDVSPAIGNSSSIGSILDCSA